VEDSQKKAVKAADTNYQSHYLIVQYLFFKKNQKLRKFALQFHHPDD